MRIVPEGVSRTRISEDHIDPAVLGFDMRAKLFEVGEAGDVRLKAFDRAADRSDSLVELGLSATGDNDAGPLCHKAACRRQTHAAAAAGHESDLSCQFGHCRHPL